MASPLSPSSLALLGVLGVGCASGAHTRPTPAHLGAVAAEEQTALEVVARRTEAYNAHDIEAFLATYDPAVRVYEYPDALLGRGSERMREIFGPQFAQGEGSIVVHSRHALGNVVLSDETVRLYGKVVHNIGVYTVADGHIVEVRLIEPERPR